MNEYLIKIGGCYHIAFAIFHLLFWKLFKWKKDLKNISWINRSVMQILNLRIIYLFLVFSFISLFYTKELLNTELGRIINLSISYFWILRTVEQFIFFSVKDSRSLLMVIIFISGAILYLVPTL
jgi:hypothetical protein